MPTNLAEYLILTELYFSTVPVSRIITVSFQIVLSYEYKLNCIFTFFLHERLNETEENNVLSFCQNSGRAGLRRNVPSMESSHTPELLRVTSTGMSHTLPKYLSWQEQKIFRDLSPGTIASVSQLQFSRLRYYTNFNLIPNSTSHLYKYLRKAHEWLHTVA